MTIDEWIRQATALLTDAGIESARLDAIILLEDRLGINRALLLAHDELAIDPDDIVWLNELVERRLTHEPLAYIRGRCEFYGRDFMVNEHVLVPRPESETIIDLLKLLPLDDNSTIVDVGTGSGALAVTAKLEHPQAQVIAIDIDRDCLEVARSNATRHAVDIELVEGDLLSPLADTNYPDLVLLCNLPYVPDAHSINQAATHEPRLALFAGPDGLDCYRKLFEQITVLRLHPRHIIAESLPSQHRDLEKIAAKHNFRLQQTKDFIQVFGS